MKKRALYIFCMFLSFILTGCWNSRELDTVSIVEAVGIDKMEDGQIRLTYQILKPSAVKGPAGSENGGSGGGKSVWVVTTTGKTLFEAVRNAATQADRRSYFAQNKVIIISEEAAKSGIAQLFDLSVRDPDFRETVYVFIAKGEAKDIIDAEHEQEKVPAKAIENLAKAMMAVSKVPKVTLYDLLKSLVSKTTDSFVPGIELTEREQNEMTEKMVELKETAVFKEDKLTGWFNSEETRGLLWILGKVKSGIVIFPLPDAETQGAETKKVALEIIRASSKVKPELVDGKPVVTVEVKVESNLGEQMSQVDLTKPETFKQLEEKQAEVILKEINAALDKARKSGVDVFKFGEEFHRKFPEDWPELEENWDEEFKEIEVHVSVDSSVRSVGLSTKPIVEEE